MGVARIHMFILSVLSIGFYFALGVFQREYQKFLDHDQNDKKSNGLNKKKSVDKSERSVSKAKRED